MYTKCLHFVYTYYKKLNSSFFEISYQHWEQRLSHSWKQGAKPTPAEMNGRGSPVGKIEPPHHELLYYEFWH